MAGRAVETQRIFAWVLGSSPSSAYRSWVSMVRWPRLSRPLQNLLANTFDSTVNLAAYEVPFAWHSRSSRGGDSGRCACIPSRGPCDERRWSCAPTGRHPVSRRGVAREVVSHPAARPVPPGIHRRSVCARHARDGATSRAPMWRSADRGELAGGVRARLVLFTRVAVQRPSGTASVRSAAARPPWKTVEGAE